MAETRPFGLMVKKPGEHYYAAPCVATGQAEDLWDGSLSPELSPFDMKDGDWSVFLPHHCDEWIIATGDRESVLAEARRFRAELDAAIGTLEGSAP